MALRQIVRRKPVVDFEELPNHLPLLLRRIYANRGVLGAQEVDYSTAGLLHPHGLEGMEAATAELYRALVEGVKIVVVGDFDADGATSTALVLLALNAFGAKGAEYLVPSRFTTGYGLSSLIVEQAVQRGAELILTVDTGISSHAGAECAQQHGIRLVITDHHLPGPTLPPAAAIVNPQLPGSLFPSKFLAGVGVAFYLLSHLAAKLRRARWFEVNSIREPNLAEWLDLVALGTVADLVPLDRNNRILVHQGVRRIRAGFCRPGIKALLEVAKCDIANLVSRDLAFVLAPRLNAAGRLDDISIGIELLLCTDYGLALKLAHLLDDLNQSRRAIEKEMQQEAMEYCQQLTTDQELPFGLALYQPGWHQGVVGILAARLKSHFHRPAIAFAPADSQLLRGSGRSIPGCHLRDLIAQLDQNNPGLITSFGGHAMAVGLSIAREQFPNFKRLFGSLVAEKLDESLLAETIWSDGELGSDEFTLEMAQLIRDAAPWGQGFPEPIFDGMFTLHSQRPLAGGHLKMELIPLSGTQILEAVAFNVDSCDVPAPNCRQLHLAYRLEVNLFRSRRTLQLVVERLREAN